MKTRYKSFKALSFGLWITTAFLFFRVAFSDDPPLDGPGCVLNFTSFPYEPTGECIGKRERINMWDSTQTNLCCQNFLTALSQSLALQASIDEGNIFLNKDQWLNCITPFTRQATVSIDSCKFTNLYYGNSKCSNLSLAKIRQNPNYQNASNQCDRFNNSFDDTCTNCTKAITDVRDGLLKDLGIAGNDTEKEICGIAVVIAFTARNLKDKSLIGDLYRCLRFLNVFEPGYFKIKYSVVKTILAIVIAGLALIVVIVLIKYVTKNNKSKRQQVQTKESAIWSGLYRFSKSEIENAMNFGGIEKKSLGSGSAGQVYMGVLPSGQVVAIKHIYKSNTSDSFYREVEGLSRVRHPNLVCLFGFCAEDGEQYLVYEYCSAGNLAQHLLRKDTVLSWDRRVKILRDCALALRYLHFYIDGCIVHRDIKLTNILLTEDLAPKLSDFGLAKVLGMEESKVFTDVRGTIGYMDPEYMSNAKLTCASDIYSFGIVALQILSGQKVIELDLEARDQLTRKAKDVSMGKRPLKDFEDPRLKGNLRTVEFESILQIAVLCAAKSAKGRPTIDVVFEEMDKAWKNTVADMRARKELSSSATPQSRSIEVMPV